MTDLSFISEVQRPRTTPPRRLQGFQLKSLSASCKQETCDGWNTWSSLKCSVHIPKQTFSTKTLRLHFFYLLSQLLQFLHRWLNMLNISPDISRQGRVIIKFCNSLVRLKQLWCNRTMLNSECLSVLFLVIPVWFHQSAQPPPVLEDKGGMCGKRRTFFGPPLVLCLHSKHETGII